MMGWSCTVLDGVSLSVIQSRNRSGQTGRVFLLELVNLIQLSPWERWKGVT